MSGVQILDRFAHLYDFSIPGPSLESLTQSPDDEDLTPHNLPKLETGSKFIFPAPLDDDASTVEPGSNTTSEAQLEYDDEFSAPASANDPRNKQHSSPQEMENALYRNILKHAIAAWQEEFVNLNPEFMPTDKIKKSIVNVNQWTEFLLHRLNVKCSRYNRTQD